MLSSESCPRLENWMSRGSSKIAIQLISLQISSLVVSISLCCHDHGRIPNTRDTHAQQMYTHSIAGRMKHPLAMSIALSFASVPRVLYEGFLHHPPTTHSLLRGHHRSSRCQWNHHLLWTLVFFLFSLKLSFPFLCLFQIEQQQEGRTYSTSLFVSSRLRL